MNSEQNPRRRGRPQLVGEAAEQAAQRRREHAAARQAAFRARRKAEIEELRRQAAASRNAEKELAALHMRVAELERRSALSTPELIPAPAGADYVRSEVQRNWRPSRTGAHMATYAEAKGIYLMLVRAGKKPTVNAIWEALRGGASKAQIKALIAEEEARRTD